ncbi:MAG: adenosylmethionine decarboxylase [Alphaproteobacteria bacterium]|nr:adenosylmethionine decarboxylase [Alphaproteobacteria bacterium]
MRTHTLAVTGQRSLRDRNLPANKKPRLVPKVVPTETASDSNDVVATTSAAPKSEELKGYFVQADGVQFAGRHLIVDLWDAKNLDDIEIIEAMLRESAEVAGATLLDVQLHHFGPNQGVSGVALLAESHISIHTWPERGYAAIDLFMCGSCNPYKAVPAMKRALKPGQVQLAEQRRGIVG